MIIETPILNLAIGIFPIADRENVEQSFFENAYSINQLNYNLSHAGDWLVLAKHPTLSIGIDLEIGPPPTDFMSVAKTFFWPDEYLFLANYPDKKQQGDCFLSLWTAKEAVCKLYRSTISDSLPGPNFIDWLKDGCPTIYEFMDESKSLTIFCKKGIINSEEYFITVAM